MIRFAVVFNLSVAALSLSFLFALANPRGQGQTSLAIASTEQHKRYAGDAACTSCHSEQASTYTTTAHHLTSQLPSESSILGPFTAPSNTLKITDPQNDTEEPRLSFTMSRKPEGFFQTAVADLGSKHLTHSEPIDLVFGSGVRGQTYLYWTGEQLSELPVSYWTDGHRWINSPGYKDGTANFSRHADARCTECHTTYIRALSPSPASYSYDRATLVPGISCETCHGPGAEHVALERTHKAGSPLLRNTLIVNPASLNRARQIDACALCHNGTQGFELRPAFSFVPGDTLADFISRSQQDTDEHPDVHGNQTGLLERSRCYLNSPKMTCATCHEVHAPERSAASYSPRCLQCHTWQSCGASKTLGPRIKSNCVDCHMPLQETAAIVSVTAGEVIRASIRTHWIKVYRQAPQSGNAGQSDH